MNKLQIISSFISQRYLKKFKSRKKLERYQAKKLIKHLEYTKRNSDYFKEKCFSAKKLEEFPIMDKNIMMENFDRMNTVNISRDEALEIAMNGEKTRDFSQKCNGVSVGLSSGTSGHRGLFIISDKETAKWVGTILAKNLPKKIFGHRIAFFLRADNNLYESISSKFIKFKYFDIYKDMKKNLLELNDYKPSILVAPPSVLLQIAEAMEKNVISINPLKIISVAEVLEKSDEEYFKKVFKKETIFQIYQCTEGFLGYVCPHGTFHLNEDMVYVEKEYIDDKRFIPIITDFERKSQPIIRYRLNDILVEKKEKCKCGSSIMAIEKIEGRDDDIFIFDGIDNCEVKVFSDFIRRCMIFTDGINNYTVIQKAKNKIIIQMSDISEDKKQKIIYEFKNLAKDMKFILPKIEFEEYCYNNTKKLKRVERMF